jgi:hypothetical protein
VDVGKQRQQAKHCHDFELQFLRLVRHLLRQGVQAQIKIADHQNRDDQNDTDNQHEDVGVAGSGDEGWQVMGSDRIKGLVHAIIHSRNASDVLSLFAKDGAQTFR